MTKVEQYQSVVGRINWILFLVAVFALPFPQIISRYALVTWLVGWVLELRWLQSSHLKKQLSNLKYITPILLFGIWYAWRALSGLWSPDHRAWSFMMERYMTFGLLVPVALWGVNARYDWRTAGKVLAIACALSVPFYVIFFTALHTHPEWVKALGYQDWNFTVSNWWLSFMENCSYIKHRLFWCTTQLIGVVAAFQVWKKNMDAKSVMPILKWPLALIMLSAIPLSGSRQTIFTAAALLVIAIISILPKKHRWLYGTGVVVIGLAIGCSVLITHPRMKIIMADELSLEQLTKHESRLGIWSVALSEPKDYIWTGLGGGQSVNYLKTKYSELKMRHYQDRNYHAHNQYLEEFMELGIFGLIFFVLAWLSILLLSEGIGKQTAAYFVAAYGLNMLTDCMWGKFDGIALWAVMMIIILLQSRSTKQLT